ncbi:MAG: cupredoxin domain-containing protein [Candidatus Aenigmarchaeota archaeon]
MKGVLPLLVISLVAVLLVSGCTQPAAPETGQETSDQVTQPGLTDTTPAPTEGPVVREFTMEAKQFEFVPDTITVNQGDTVRLMITSTDVKHGFNLPIFEIKVDLPPGETVEVEFVADKKGTFPFRCHVFCGTGHYSMMGTLVVE